MMSVYISSFMILSCFSVAFAIQCFQCGQYNDGVGSITPCINYTHMVLKDCPNLEQKWCIKYVSEGTTIRDCVQKCTEKETWGTQTYCCNENGCNGSSSTRFGFLVLLLSTCALWLRHQMDQSH